MLVADDDPSLLPMLVRTLEGAGHEVLTARDGDEALRVVSAHRERLEVAVLDAALAPRGARELVEAVREDAGIVVVSGGALESNLEELVHARGGAFLRKPFATEALRRSVLEVGSR